MVSRVVLMKFGLVSVNTARQVNAAHSKTIVNVAKRMSYLSKTAHSTVKRPIHKNTTFKNSNFNQRINIVKDKNVNTVRPKAIVNAVRPKAILNAVKGNNVNVVKASACWVWKPKTKVLDHLHALVDGKKKIVTEASVRRDLKLEDEKGMIKNLDNVSGNFLMYPRRVESFEDEGLGEEDASKQGRIADIDANKDIYLVNVHTDEDMFGVNDLDGDEVIVDNVDVVETDEIQECGYRKLCCY
ncbi:hypothetical protein Tco_1326586 [Tanacetum coccineum]